MLRFTRKIPQLQRRFVTLAKRGNAHTVHASSESRQLAQQSMAGGGNPLGGIAFLAFTYYGLFPIGYFSFSVNTQQKVCRWRSTFPNRLFCFESFCLPCLLSFLLIRLAKSSLFSFSCFFNRKNVPTSESQANAKLKSASVLSFFLVFILSTLYQKKKP